MAAQPFAELVIPTARPASDSRLTLVHIMTIADTNLHGNVHGGVIMKLCDDVAGAVASRHSGGRAVTVSMDELVLLVPVNIGDLVRAHATVNWAGRSSMEVGVRVEAERWDVADGPVRHVASAYLVFVGIDADARPRQVPALTVDDSQGDRRFREAEIRRRHRLERRKDILAARGPQLATTTEG